MLGTPFAPWPSFTDAEIQAVTSVLQSNRVNYWTGQEGRQFENEFASYFDSAYAVALANGTLALDAALVAIGVGPGDEVIVTPRTFLASVSSIINVGAKPVFADVSLDSQNITPETVNKVITKRTRAIMLVHLAGWPCDMDGFTDLASVHSLRLIEDCAQAHGARFNGYSVGTLGDIGAWSFCQDKIMSTGGEGGMITTNHEEYWSTIWSLKDHGKSWDAVNEKPTVPGFRWLHKSFGTNWRLTEPQSAIGRLQLNYLPEWTNKRRENAQFIWSYAQSVSGLRVPELPNNIEHAAYKCYVFLKPEALKSGWSRERIIREIESRGVPCFSGSCSEVYLEDAFEGTGLKPEKRLPNARELGDTSLMFLVHPTLTEDQIKKTTETLKDVMQLATR